MPAAAVIPAPIVYINAVAVKKLVVGSRRSWSGWQTCSTALFERDPLGRRLGALNRVSLRAKTFTLKKLECSKQALHA